MQRAKNGPKGVVLCAHRRGFGRSPRPEGRVKSLRLTRFGALRASLPRSEQQGTGASSSPPLARLGDEHTHPFRSHTARVELQHHFAQRAAQKGSRPPGRSELSDAVGPLSRTWRNRGERSEGERALSDWAIPPAHATSSRSLAGRRRDLASGVGRRRRG